MKRVASIETLSEYIGAAAAVRLSQAMGGTSVKVPKNPAGSVWAELVQALGERSATELVECFGGEGLYIARNAAEEREQRRAEIAQALAAGKSYREIARTMTVTTRYTERGLRRIMASEPHCHRAHRVAHHPDQMGLFQADAPPLNAEFPLGAAWGGIVAVPAARD